MTDGRDRYPRKLTHGSLFSGIGGFDLGFSWASIETLWQVEKSEFCRTILERHFPHAKRHKDVREVGAKNLCKVDIISGGSPCQDISGASPRRKGLEGERSRLWREMHRVCSELLPAWVIYENVPELRARGADTIAAAMEDLGYTVSPYVVGAHILGAPHRRDRVWIVCHLDEGDGTGARGIRSLSQEEERELGKAQQEWRRVQHELGGTVGDDGRPSYQAIRREFYGVPHGMDRRALAALGNAVVPQIPMLIGSFIRQYEQGGPGRKDPSPAPSTDAPTPRDFDPPPRQTVVINSEFVSWARTYSGPKFHGVLCDPSYGYHFMNAEWDDPKQMTKNQDHSNLPPGQRMTTQQENLAFQAACKEWGEAMLPHLYPGALIFMFGGPRMFEWLSTGMQLAGFEHWDTFCWLHAQGFPKAMDVGKAIDKKNGNEREVTGRNPNSREASDQSNTLFESGTVGKTDFISSGNSGWDGWKTPALKPAWEPILCFRAPRGNYNYVELATTFGSGCLNIGSSRVVEEELPEAKAGQSRVGTFIRENMVTPARKGRYAANLIFDESSARMLDAQSKVDASRFFYCAKASSQERNAGCEDLPAINSGMSGGAQAHGEGYDKGQGLGFNRVIPRYNNHPCVKPLALTRHIATLLLPPASVESRRLFVPFCGSGSEMIGAMQAGWDEIVGVEQDGRYCEIARRRIEYWRNSPLGVTEAN